MTSEQTPEVLRILGTYEALSSKEMLRDLAATFPELHVVPESHSSAFLRGSLRARIDRVEGALMPDGFPIFCDTFYDMTEGRGHRNVVHGAFEAWLNRRGWYTEPDGGDPLSYCLVQMEFVL